jgi:hypothetical protein
MNEQIKDFLKQNDLCIVDGEITECGIEEAKKFAELIEKECVQASAGFVPGYGLEPFSELFNKHYGVKK